MWYVGRWVGVVMLSFVMFKLVLVPSLVWFWFCFFAFACRTLFASVLASGYLLTFDTHIYIAIQHMHTIHTH